MTALAGFPVESLAIKGETLQVEALSGGVMRLALERPALRNAFDAAMVRELASALEELEAIPLRLLLLEGEGSVFCAGADLGAMREQGAASMESNLENAREMGRLFHRLASFPAPVACLVQGAAIGGGLGLAACSDFVLAEPGAVFATSEVMLGLVPAVIGPYVVRKLGLAQAGPLMLTGTRVRAEALLGTLVHRLIDPAGTREEALARVVREFLAAGPDAARATKQLLLRISPLPDPGLAEFAARTIATARGSAEGQAGLQAFFQKIPPPWAPPQGKA